MSNVAQMISKIEKSRIEITDFIRGFEAKTYLEDKLKRNLGEKEGGYLVKELRESFVIRDHDGTVIILEASMDYTATSALPQSAYP